jgi:hypothetical protein
MNMPTLNRNEKHYHNAVGPSLFLLLLHGLSLIYHFSDAFDPDRYLGDDLSCVESVAQSDFTL